MSSRQQLLQSIVGAVSLVEHRSPAVDNLRDKTRRALRRQRNADDRRDRRSREHEGMEALAR